MIGLEPDERAELIKDVQWKADVETRLQSLESKWKVAGYVLGAAALAVLTQMWEQAKGVFFK